MTMEEEWLPIRDFPGYSISSWGRVRNDKTGRLLVLLRNQQGIVQVGLMRDGEQKKRSITLLVATHFLPDPLPITFDTPINVDGDRSNNHVENLMWRPRWFAVKYFRQFDDPDCPHLKVPIEDLKTGERFKNSMDAATRFGLLDKEVMVAIKSFTYVWPTYQQFKVVHGAPLD